MSSRTLGTLFLLAGALAGIDGHTTVAAEGSPNVVLIFVDDLGYGDVGCYGATKVKTPNIDRLAREGRLFTDAHSASSVCTPSRYALLTGEYPLRAMGGKGVWGPHPVTGGLLIDTETLTIGKVFQNKGYATACIGKWHLGFKKGHNDWKLPLRPGPQDVGFDYYFGIGVVSSAPPYVYLENDGIVGYDPNDPLVYGGKPVTPTRTFPPEASVKSPNRFSGARRAHQIYDEEKMGAVLTEKAVKWIEEHKNRRFFLYFATPHIHHPITPAPRFKGTSQCGLYGDFIHELDWMVGEILNCLDRNGLTDNTLVIFTSDNGGMLHRAGRDAMRAGHKINGDLLGFKFGVWEGGHRVPFIARWPGKIKPGTVSHQLICHVDMLATFMALTGQDTSALKGKDSINMLPALVGDPDKPLRSELLLAPRKKQNLAIRKGKWVYIGARGSGGFTGSKPSDHAWGGPAAAQFAGNVNSDIVNGRIRPDAPPAQLYDLEADVNQTRNLYNEYPEVVKELSELLAKHVRSIQNSASGTQKSRPAPITPAAPSARSASFDFESGKLEPWKIVEGKFAHVIGSRDFFFHNKRKYNKQGRYYLTTLEVSPDAEKGDDKQTGVIVSPLFIPDGGTMTFRVGGGRGTNTYVALCLADGTELKQARGVNSQVMQSVTWDLTPYAGKKLFLKVVDKSTTGWGHITVDDFQFDGKILDELPELSARRGIRQQPGAKPVQADAGEGGATTAEVRSSTTERSRRSKPNFIVILADDLGYGDISCYARTGVETPHIDALAAEGFRSTDFFVPANVCSPTRAALLTGRYPMRCGMPVARNENLPKYKNYGLAPDELTIPELLKSAGYRSLMVGKWHLGLEVEGSHPLDAGFDEYLGLPSNYEPKRGDNFDTLYRGRQVERRHVPCESLAKIYTDEVVAFIQRHKDEPFFIYVSHHIVHNPLCPSKEFVGTSKKGRYGDYIKELDHSTGRIMKALRDAGLDDKTLVVFTSDNGPTPKGSTGGLAGGKYCTMEGGHRVPGIFRWPGVIPPGQVSDVTITIMDLLPLFCRLAGVELPKDRVIDGKDILPILKGESTTSPHKFLYYYNGTNLQAVREGDWKLHLPRTVQDQPFWSKKPGRRKGFITLKEPVLFNLKDDPGEKRNVANQYPDIVAHLLKQAEKIRAELGDVHTTGSDQRPINLINPQER